MSMSLPFSDEMTCPDCGFKHTNGPAGFGCYNCKFTVVASQELSLAIVFPTCDICGTKMEFSSSKSNYMCPNCGGIKPPVED